MTLKTTIRAHLHALRHFARLWYGRCYEPDCECGNSIIAIKCGRCGHVFEDPI